MARAVPRLLSCGWVNLATCPRNLATKMSDNTPAPPLSVLGQEIFGDASALLGPELQHRVAEENIRRVFAKSSARSAQLGIHGVYAPPRVLPAIARSASACDDKVTSSYLGGVLCSARTPNGRDDRAIATLRLIDGLSCYAIRAHCIVYASLLKQTDEKLSDVRKWFEQGRGLSLLFDDAELKQRMHFQDNEDPEQFLSHAFVNLSSNDLTMKGQYPITIYKEPGVYRQIHPTLRGLELFCWGTGIGQLGPNAYFAQQTPAADVEGLSVVPLRLKLGHVNWG